MHWFWRATIAALISCVAFKVGQIALWLYLEGTPSLLPWWELTVAVAMGLPLALLAIVIYTILTRRFGLLVSSDDEARIR
ncbi:MAG: hypothetical protein ACYTF1_09970 [Planctomycetota bacterium]|jgi:hypothetical protein